MIGLIHENKCFAYSYKNKGCHDIVPLNNGIVFSDTFGNVSNKSNQSGFYWDKILISLPSNMIRGFHLGEKYLISGSSINAKREMRFEGKGCIYFIDNSNEYFKFPAFTSQIHDIIGTKCNRVNNKNIKNNFLLNDSKKVKEILQKQFNNPFYESKISFQIEKNRKIYPMQNS